jgi:electron transfer flavoprotein beta subunit
VVDYRVKVRAKADGSQVELSNVKMSMNPFDEIALEEAIRLKERGAMTEVVAVSCGPPACEQILRDALAMGADRAVHVSTTQSLSALPVAKLLKALCDREQPDLVLCGKQANDANAHQTGLMLAALMDWPQADCASGISLGGRQIEVNCEVDDGLSTFAMSLPAVVTCDLRLNEPRSVGLASVIRAKRMLVERLSAETLNVSFACGLETLTVGDPPSRFAGGQIALPKFPWIWERQKRASGAMVKDVGELVQRLRNEARVI